MKQKQILSLCVGIVLLLLSITGCQKQDAQTPGQERPDAKTSEQAGSSEEATGEFKDDLSFVPMEVETGEEGYPILRVSGSADLDMDGKEERLDLHADQIHYEDTGERVEQGSFLLNNEALDLRSLVTPLRFSWMEESAESADTALISFDVVDLDPKDNKKELVVYKQIPSHGIPYSIAEMFHYENGSFVSLGEIEAGYMMTLEEAVFDPKEKTVSFETDSYSVCSFYYVETYQLQKKQIVNITENEKEMFIYNDNGERKPITCNVIGTAKIYGSPKLDNVIYELQLGDEVTFLSTTDQWVKVRVSNGRVGYLKNIWTEDIDGEAYGRYIFDGDPNKFPDEVFEDLPAWG